MPHVLVLMSTMFTSLIPGIDQGLGPGSGALGPETVVAVVVAAEEAVGDGSETGGGQEIGRDLGDSEPCRFYRMSARKCCSY
jgi:hypothetical protein